MFKKICLFVSLIILFSDCVGTSTNTPDGRQVYHIVLCWLKESGNLADRQKIIETSRSFNSIPGVLKVSVGEVIPSDRKIVDDSFDVGIIFTFSNTDDMNAYLEHPIHKDAVRNVLLPLVRKIVVYDYME